MGDSTLDATQIVTDNVHNVTDNIHLVSYGLHSDGVDGYVGWVHWEQSRATQD